MKRCPQCQRTYPDDAPAFCVNDGTRLVDEEPAAYDPQKTILASVPQPPPQQFSNPAPQPPPAAPPQNYPPPQQQPPQPQAMWPPPPQGQAQNWGGGYYQPGQQPGGYAPPQSKGLSLTALIVGAISGLFGGLLFLDYTGGVFRFSRSTAYPILICAIVTGAAALIIGLIALFSSRQRGKGLAIVGLVLGLFSIGFWIYLEAEHGVFFR